MERAFDPASTRHRVRCKEIFLRFLVSGAAGFIGSHLCDRLLAEGHDVIGLDNLVTGSPRNIAHLADHPHFEFVLHDVTLPYTPEEPVDGVLHLASLASPKEYLAHPIETLDSGSIGTRNMLEAARHFGVRFLLTSTSECYGDPLEHPQSETYWGNVNPVGLRSCYDESKRFAEALTMAYHRVHGLRTNIARIFNTYGPRMQLNDGRVVPAFLDQAIRREPITVFGDGLQTRSFCYVSDLVDGLYRLMFSEERLPVNLGNPIELTMLEFAERIQRLTGSASSIVHHPLPADDPKRRRPDITKAMQLLGWEPKVSLEEGLRSTVAYFQGLIQQNETTAVGDRG
jgi:dTDP-glucose 4,6-dehydratase